MRNPIANLNLPFSFYRGGFVPYFFSHTIYRYPLYIFLGRFRFIAWIYSKIATRQGYFTFWLLGLDFGTFSVLFFHLIDVRIREVLVFIQVLLLWLHVSFAGAFFLILCSIWLWLQGNMDKFLGAGAWNGNENTKFHIICYFYPSRM